MSMPTITPELREAFEKKFCDEKGNWADGIITAYEVMLFCAEREALARVEERESLVAKFEEIRNSAQTVRDQVYLDSVIMVISTNGTSLTQTSNTDL